ncbi:hypothetical protein PCE1_002144 [Barthelona sp. PCE]
MENILPNKEEEVRPKLTIYVRNLDEKMSLSALKRNLYSYFSRFGQVLHIRVSRTLPTRGQAWIVYSELEGSVRAVLKANNTSFFGKTIEVQYSKQPSDFERQLGAKEITADEIRERATLRKKRKAELVDKLQKGVPQKTQRTNS